MAGFLFVATLVSTTFAGLVYTGEYQDFWGTALYAFRHPAVLLDGLPFSITLLLILFAHEMGHFLACRHYGIRCTPPFFIPLPISLIGTLGAFIRIRSPFHSKRALFDVGIAGPLAGFLVVLPAMALGVARSVLVPRGALHEVGLAFGEPLLFRWIGAAVLGYSPRYHDMLVDPVAVAAWFGLLATALNLLPIWQLDGGHIAYAALGRKRQRVLSVVAAVGLVLVSFAGWPIPAYLFFGLLLLALGLKYRFYHPPTLDDHEELGSTRVMLAFAALIIMILCFTPVPFYWA